MKIALKIILWVLIALVVVAGGYVIYVFTDYYRLEDDLELPVENALTTAAETGREYKITTFNIGFGAYSDDFTFFMDEGKQSRAFSKQAVLDNMAGIEALAQGESADFYLFQEVDIGSTRSYQTEQRNMLMESFPDKTAVFAQNYDSPYLFYPITEPHGASRSGLLTLSSAEISSSVRRSLPVEKGFRKLLDLDRCYCVSQLPVEGGKTLYLVNLHLSAYSADGSIATEQLQRLLDEVSKYYKNGDYVICGGDFNKDLLGNSPEIFGVAGEYSWAQPFPFDILPEGIKIAAPYNEKDPVPTNRYNNMPYEKGVTFVNVLDGFHVSDNVTVSSCETVDGGFKNSDHNPVTMSFTLEP